MEFSINLKAPSNPENQQPDDYEQQMLNQAIGFFQAGSRCSADFRLSPNLTNSLSAPAAVCYALAIEIYFKLLLKIYNIQPPKKHDFLTLLNTLPPEAKIQIISRSQMSDSDLANFIKPISDTFVKWRYLYEQDTAWTSVPNLARLGQVLHNTIRHLKPTLKVSYENRLSLPENFQY